MKTHVEKMIARHPNRNPKELVAEAIAQDWKMTEQEHKDLVREVDSDLVDWLDSLQELHNSKNPEDLQRAALLRLFKAADTINMQGTVTGQNMDVREFHEAISFAAKHVDESAPVRKIMTQVQRDDAAKHNRGETP